LHATRSRIAVTQSGTGLYLEPFTLGGTLVADSVTITGDPACPQCGNGVYSEHVPVTVSHFTGSSLNFALEFFDSTVSVTHSTITDSYTGLYAVGSQPTPRATVRGLTATNTQYPVEIQNMVMVADSLMLSGGTE